MSESEAHDQDYSESGSVEVPPGGSVTTAGGAVIFGSDGSNHHEVSAQAVAPHRWSWPGGSLGLLECPLDGTIVGGIHGAQIHNWFFHSSGADHRHTIAHLARSLDGIGLELDQVYGREDASVSGRRGMRRTAILVGLVILLWVGLALALSL